MTRYVRETHCYADGGFDVDGRVVAVLNHSDLKQRLTVLVEKEDPTFVVGVGEESPSITTYFCNHEKSDGGQCTREVDEYGERCWQHEDEE